MTTVRDLRAERGTVRAELETLVDQIEALEAADDLDEKRLDELLAKGEELRTKLAALDKEIQRQEKLADFKRNTASPSDDRKPPAGSVVIKEFEPHPTFEFKSVVEFAQAVRNASPGAGRFDVDDRLRKYAAPTNFHETGGSEGFLVPPQYRQEIWELVFQGQSLLSMVDLEPTSSNSVSLIADETTPWGTGGVEAKWRAEGSQMTATKLGVEPRMVHLHELYAFVLATDELLSDAPRMRNRLTRKAAEAINWKINDAILHGTGVAQPLGILNSNAKVVVTKETNQPAATVEAKNLSKMFSRLLRQPNSRQVWLMNSDVLPELIGLTIGDMPVFIPPSDGIRGAPDGVLFGRPIVVTEHSPSLGSEGDIILADMRGYYAVNKAGGVSFASSIHLYFDYGIEAFRWTVRIGGQPYLSAPVSPARGTATKSHFVVLGART